MGERVRELEVGRRSKGTLLRRSASCLDQVRRGRREMAKSETTKARRRLGADKGGGRRDGKA